MIDINTHNYESFLLDYSEGKLSDAQIEQLISFIYSNPELIDEFEKFKNIGTITPEKSIFPNKQKLYKQEIISNNLSNFDELCIAKLEGDLTQQELEEFNTFLYENSDKNKNFSLFEKTINIPDLSVHFENKESLKYKQIPINTQNRFLYYSIAASIVALFSILMLTPKNIQLYKIEQNDLLSSSKIQSIQNIEIKNTEKISDNFKTLNSNNTKIYALSNGNKVKVNNLIKNSGLNKTELISLLDPVVVEISNNKIEGHLVDVTLTEMKENTLYSEIKEPSLKNIVIETVNTQVLKKDKDLNRISGWDIAQLGINGINKITGSKIQLNKKYDNKGNLAKVEFDSKLFAFSAPVKK